MCAFHCGRWRNEVWEGTSKVTKPWLLAKKGMQIGSVWPPSWFLPSVILLFSSPGLHQALWLHLPSSCPSSSSHSYTRVILECRQLLRHALPLPRIFLCLFIWQVSGNHLRLGLIKSLLVNLVILFIFLPPLSPRWKMVSSLFSKVFFYYKCWFMTVIRNHILIHLGATKYSWMPTDRS